MTELFDSPEKLQEQISDTMNYIEETAKKIWSTRHPEGTEHHDKEHLFVSMFYVCLQVEMLKRMKPSDQSSV